MGNDTHDMYFKNKDIDVIYRIWKKVDDETLILNNLYAFTELKREILTRELFHSFLFPEPVSEKYVSLMRSRFENIDHTADISNVDAHFTKIGIPLLEESYEFVQNDRNSLTVYNNRVIEIGGEYPDKIRLMVPSIAFRLKKPVSRLDRQKNSVL